LAFTKKTHKTPPTHPPRPVTLSVREWIQYFLTLLLVLLLSLAPSSSSDVLQCSALQCVAVCCSVLQCAAMLLSRTFAFSSPFSPHLSQRRRTPQNEIQGAMKRGRPETSFVSCWHSASSEVRMSTLTIEPPLACVCVCVYI